MPADQPVAITASLLDRLIQPTAGAAVRQAGWGTALSQLKQSLRRDLEALLNTRRRPGRLGGELAELSRSVIRYGIPDFTALNLAAPERQAAFGRALETVIRDFEPRLAQVSVTPLPGDRTAHRTLRFRVEAVIRVEPTPEPIVFESVLDPISRTFQVKADPNG